MPASPRITPLLVYLDIQAAHDFLVDGFGFEAGTVDRNEAGQAIHGEVHAGGEAIWLHRVTAEHGLDSPRSQDSAFGGLAVVVEDVDAHCDQARSAGATIDHPPVDQPYGRREYGATDPEGHRWWFGAPLS